MNEIMNFSGKYKPGIGWYLLIEEPHGTVCKLFASTFEGLGEKIEEYLAKRATESKSDH